MLYTTINNQNRIIIPAIPEMIFFQVYIVFFRLKNQWSYFKIILIKVQDFKIYLNIYNYIQIQTM